MGPTGTVGSTGYEKSQDDKGLKITRSSYKGEWPLKVDSVYLDCEKDYDKADDRVMVMRYRGREYGFYPYREEEGRKDSRHLFGIKVVGDYIGYYPGEEELRRRAVKYCQNKHYLAP